MDRPYEIIGDKHSCAGRRVRVIGRHPVLDRVGVPIGYECDGASLPGFLHIVFGHPTDYPQVIAAIAHDFSYEEMIGTRKEADVRLREDMVEVGCGRAKSAAFYYAVRLFGGSHWGVK